MKGQTQRINESIHDEPFQYPQRYRQTLGPTVSLRPSQLPGLCSAYRQKGIDAEELFTELSKGGGAVPVEAQPCPITPPCLV
eukprot:3748369-Amphidinium_carterae.1